MLQDFCHLFLVNSGILFVIGFTTSKGWTSAGQPLNSLRLTSLDRNGPWLGPPLAKGPDSMLSVWGIFNKGLVEWNDATSSMRHGSFWCGMHTGGGLWASEASVFLASLKPYVFFEVDIDNFDPYPTDSALITSGDHSCYKWSAT